MTVIPAVFPASLVPAALPLAGVSRRLGVPAAGREQKARATSGPANDRIGDNLASRSGVGMGCGLRFWSWLRPAGAGAGWRRRWPSPAVAAWWMGS